MYIPIHETITGFKMYENQIRNVIPTGIVAIGIMFLGGCSNMGPVAAKSLEILSEEQLTCNNTITPLQSDVYLARKEDAEQMYEQRKGLNPHRTKEQIIAEVQDLMMMSCPATPPTE